jgi:hypothetical protein
MGLKLALVLLSLAWSGALAAMTDSLGQAELLELTKVRAAHGYPLSPS